MVLSGFSDSDPCCVMGAQPLEAARVQGTSWTDPALLFFFFFFFEPQFHPSGSNGKASAYNAGDRGSISGPLQYSCLEYPVDGEAWRATVHGVAKGGHS